MSISNLVDAELSSSVINLEYDSNDYISETELTASEGKKNTPQMYNFRPKKWTHE